MDIFVFLSGFIYRIKYKLFFGAVAATALALFFSGFIPKKYVVTTTIFTGITSKTSLDDMGGRTDWTTSNNAHDNIINLIRSKAVLEMVSIDLIAQHLIHGDAENDNKYIQAVNYRNLLKIAEPVLGLVDKNSHEKTVKNLLEYKEEGKDNFIFAVFNWDNKYYGYLNLSKIKVARKGSSDMLELSYECDDPGIAANTLIFLNKQLAVHYESLLLSASNDVVKHFEEQLRLAREKLTVSEDSMVAFNIANGIVNYEEQTKHLSAMNNAFENRYEEVLLLNNSSKALVKELESQMEVRTKLVRENEKFLDELNKISNLNGQIAEIEVFGGDQKSNVSLDDRKAELKQTENKIKDIAGKIDKYKFTQQGVVISDMVSQWLDAVIKAEKSEAELKVMHMRKDSIDKLFAVFSPVGPNLGRHSREVRVNEESYLTILHHLGLAKLKNKNILLDAGTLQVVTQPDFPLLSVPRKRQLYVLGAFIASIVLIFGYYLIIELLDRTVRDGQRATRFTGCRVLGAFPSSSGIRHRRFGKQVNNIAISHLANIFNGYIKDGQPLIINLMSIDKGEGKSHIAQQLEHYWDDKGFKVTYASYDEQFDQESRAIMHSARIADVLGSESLQGADIILVEYAPLKQSMVPSRLLEEASCNVLILDAQRAWTASDSAILDNLRHSAGEKPALIYLNNAAREVVQQYVGLLPPYTAMRKLAYTVFNFGITAKH